MNAPETWTVGRLLTWTTDYLKKHGSGSPRLEAEVLLAYARDCKRIELYTAFGDEPSDEVKAAFRDMVRRRAEGSPVAYLVGHKEFYSMEFEVNSDVLVPRPETEHLVVAALDLAAQLHSQLGRKINIADVGTGSGAIALSVAKHFDASHVTAIDVSPAALDVARRNAAKHELGQERVSFVEGDLLSGLPADQKFDLILSNPPYVSQSEYDTLDKTVREFEPKLALVGGEQGFELIAKLLQQAQERLQLGGSVVIEFSPMLATKLSQFVDDSWGATVSKDLAGKARILTLRRAK